MLDFVRSHVCKRSKANTICSSFCYVMYRLLQMKNKTKTKNKYTNQKQNQVTREHVFTIKLLNSQLSSDCSMYPIPQNCHSMLMKKSKDEHTMQ